jgi:hypothetical protein
MATPLEVINSFFAKHRELAQDDHNVQVLSAELRKHFSTLSGEITFTEAYLEMALANVGPQLHYYASPETTARLEQVSQQAQQLSQQVAAEKAEKDRRAAAVARDQLFEQRQRNRQPGRASAFEDAETAEDQARTRQQQAEAAQRQQQHAAFLSELRDIEIHLEISNGQINYARTEDSRRRMKSTLAKKYEIFASEIK